MKKSSVLMYAYVLVLFVVIILDYFLKQGITTRVAVAAAVASYFFSFAEMNELVAKRKEASISVSQSIDTSIDGNIKRIESYIKKYSDKYLLIEKRVENYKDFDGAKNILSFIQRAYRTLENMSTLAQKMKELKSGLKPQIESWGKKRRNCIVLSRIFLFIGFFLFFILVLFDSISTRLSSMQNAISISAFAMVVFCYEFKDQSDEDNKALIDKKKQSDEMEREVLELTNDDFATGLLSIEIDQLIAMQSPLESK